MRVIGYHPASYTFDDGKVVSGTRLHLTYPIDSEGGMGQACESVFLSSKKISGYIPVIGDEIVIDRSRGGSVRGIILLKSAMK